MAVAFESYAVTTAESGTSAVVNKPTGTVEGDWLIATLSVRDTPTSLTPPDGSWTNVVNELDGDPTSGNCLTSVWKKKAGGSEPSTYTFTWTGSGDHVCTIARYSGGDATDIVDAVATIAQSGQAAAGSDGDDIVCPSVTTTVDGCLVLRTAAQNRGSDFTRTAPGSHTERWQEASGTANGNNWQGNADATQASAGATGTATWVSNSGRAGGGITIALKPDAGGGGATVPALDEGMFRGGLQLMSGGLT